MIENEKINAKSSNSGKKSNITVFSMILIITAIIFLISINSASATDWNVTPGGSIQTVINDAADNDNITVYADNDTGSTYNENIIVNKKLTISTNGKVTVTASDENNPVFSINSDGSSSTLQGFTITGSTYSSGIYLNGASNCVISGNTIINNNLGIDISGGSDNTVLGNNITGNYDNGISISNSQENAISENNLTSNAKGIYLYNSDNNNISENNVTNSIYDGIILESGSFNTVSGNNVTGNGGCGINFQNVGNNTISGNNITANNDWGLQIIGTDDPTLNITGNTIDENGNGVYLRNVSNVTLDNTAHKNKGTSFYLYNVNNVTIKNNIIEELGEEPELRFDYGVFLAGTNRNITLQNLSIRNSVYDGIRSNGNIYGLNITNTTIFNAGWQGIGITDGIFSSNITITNTTITNSIFSGITINDVLDNVIIDKCYMNQNGGYGIYVNAQGNTRITNNILNNNGYNIDYDPYGLYIMGNNNPTLNLNNNTITNNKNGIYLQYVNGNATVPIILENFGSNGGYQVNLYNVNYVTIRNNTFNNTGSNSKAVYITGINSNVKLENLTINGASGNGINVTADDLDGFNISNVTINNSNCGIEINNGRNINIQNSTITNNTIGIEIQNGDNINIKSSTITGNVNGIRLGTTNSAFNFNRILNNLYYYGSGTLNATNNWWGSNSTPASRIQGNVNFSPWLILKVTANPASVDPNENSTIAADLTWNSNNVQPTGGYIPNGIPASFETTSGTIGSSSTTNNGTAQSTFNGVHTATVSAAVDNETVNTTVLVRGSSDLEPSNLTTNSTLYTGITYPVSVTITNIGVDDAETFKVRLYDNGNPGEEKTVDGGLIAGGHVTLTWNWTPAFGTPGVHTLKIVTDSFDQLYETNESNNNITATVNVSGRPDLVPSNLTTNSTLYTGITYPINVTVTNNGDANAGNFDVELFDGSTSLGIRNVTSLGIGASTLLTWNWTPSFGTPGIHTLKIVTDTPDQLYEFNENNNNLTANFTATGRPDIIPTNITTNGTIYTSISYPVNVTITNNGDASAGSFNVELFDGLNSLGTRNVASLGIGASTVLTWNWMPAFGTTGLHTLKAVADSLNQSYEFNETNNNLTANFTVTGRPDLVSSNLTTNNTIYTGLFYPVNVNVTNNGDSSAGSFNVELFDGSTSLGTRNIANLGIGASTQLTWDWTPAIGTPGVHALKIVTDSLNESYEFNETNNNLTQTVNITGRPDFIPTNITTNNTIYTGLTYPVNVTVTNNGDANAGTFKVRLYDNGTLVEEKTINGLNSLSHTNLTWNWTPAKYTVGIHSFLITTDLDDLIYEIDEANNNIISNFTVTGRPDLIPSNLTTNSTLYTGLTYPVNVTVTNNGDANAGTFTVKLLDGTTGLGWITVNGLAVGGNTNITFNWNPTITGLHTLKIQTDCYNNITESDETNNLINQTINVNGRPDLVPSNLITNSSLYTGITYPVNVTITNNGDASSESFIVELFDGTTSLGTKNITSLGIGSSTVLTWNWTPAFGEIGTHTLKIVTDTLNQQYESNEINNQIMLNMTINGRPDLIPSNLTTNNTIYTGITYPVNVTITNNGDSNADSFYVELFDGTNSLGTQNVTGLGIGASTLVTWNWTPTFGTTGTHTLKAVSDSLNQLYEFNETNNNLTTNITANGRPDLVPSNLTTNSTPYTTTTYPINVTITNNGDSSSGAFSVELLDSLTILGTQSVPNLEPGAFTTLTWNWTPALEALGLHTLSVIADWNNQLFEINETNNEITTNVTAIGRPDLVTSNFVTTNMLYNNITYPVNVTITNNGDLNSGMFTVKLSDGSTGIGWIPVNGLTVGASTTITFNWKPTILGDHALKIQTDCYNNITESNETNNQITLNVTVNGRPDLTPSNLTTNSTSYTGISYPVNVTITNNGNAEANNFVVELFDGLTSLGTQNVSNLGIGAFTILSWNWIPQFGSAGDHTLKIVTDISDQLYESNETNNNITTIISVNGRPDLVASNLTTNNTIYTGITYPVNVTITNNGDAAAGNFNVELFDGTTSLGTQNVTSLGIGSSTILTWNWRPAAIGILSLKAVIDSTNLQSEINETNNEIVNTVSAIGRSDLVPLNITTNSTIYTNTTYPVNVTVTNNGDASAENFNIELFDGSTSLGKRNVSILGIGASTTLSWNWTPTFGSPGIHTLRALVDSDSSLFEINETNNEITKNVTAIGRPDLIPLNLTTNNNIYTNITYPVNVTIKNIGDLNVGTFTVKLSDGSTGIGWITVNGLAGGASTTITFNWKPTTAELHTLKIQTDCYNNITETNETNNQITSNITSISLPDLIASNITTSSSIYTNNTYPVTVTISNNGASDAGAFTVKLSDGSTGIGWIPVNGLTAGANTTITFNWKPTTAGLHTLKIQTDCYNNITESNETNNQITKNVTVVSVPDLKLSNLQLPENPQTGQTSPVTITISNNGTLDAGTFTVKLYDNNAGMGWITVNGLAVGASTTITFNWKPTTSGLHTLKIQADCYNNITESNETNNQITLNTTVSSLPDLIPSNITTNDTINTNVTYPLTVTITNNGTVDAGAFTVKLLDGSTGIGWITVNGLGAGASTTITFDWKPTTAGLHTLKIQTDCYNNVTESSEKNNVITLDKVVN